MARLAGINVPVNKRVEVGLTYIHGIGRSSANEILAEDPVRGRATDPVDVGEADLDSLVDGDVDSGDSRHLEASCLLALPLLVAGVRADHEHDAAPADDPAALTHRLYGRSNFHLESLAAASRPYLPLPRHFVSRPNKIWVVSNH